MLELEGYSKSHFFLRIKSFLTVALVGSSSFYSTLYNKRNSGDMKVPHSVDGSTQVATWFYLYIEWKPASGCLFDFLNLKE